ncbi:M20/M25/M40 family metallo-hydrolase [Candidatus Roizmanbacteria bacterium]|nr:M20/M25/M40 family metallo-hydrolase [Candidatus Roizmanbacteria bacterium]
MIAKILSLSKKLISVPSTKENPKEILKVLEVAEAAVGKGFAVDRFKKNGSPSLLIHNQKPGTKKFKIILDAHLDVVPGKDYQYKPYEKDGKLYGRGAYDMKAPGAAEILVFKELAKKVSYPLALQLVTDEEIGGFNGAKHQVDEGVRADFTIAGESTELGIKNAAKGIVWANIKARGQAAHGAYLWQGKSAIWMIQCALNALETKFPEPKKEIWKTTINVSKIYSSNDTYNKVAEDCTLGIDVRFIPEDAKTIVNKIKNLLPKEVELEVLVNEPAQFTPETNEYVTLLKNASKEITGKKAEIIVKHGGSDIRHFNRVGCEGVEYGPHGHGIHTDDEWVDIKSLEAYYKILKAFLLSVEKNI